MTELTQAQQSLVADLVGRLRAVPGVAAVALGGSFARGTAKAGSDIDLGLYYRDGQPFEIEAIRAIAAEMNDTPEPVVAGFGGWGPWVNGGAWLTIGGQRVDFLYRSLDRLGATVDACQRGAFQTDYEQQPATGFYSYIYLGELDICQPLHDPDGTLAALKARVWPYPPALRAAVLARFGIHAGFALDHLDKAAASGDVYMAAGCLYRALSAQVQMLYALNGRYFINDKRAIDECAAFERLPADFAARMSGLLAAPGATPNALGETAAQARTLFHAVQRLAEGA